MATERKLGVECPAIGALRLEKLLGAARRNVPLAEGGSAVRHGVARLKRSRFRMLIWAIALALAILHGETANAAGSSQEVPTSSAVPPHTHARTGSTFVTMWVAADGSSRLWVFSYSASRVVPVLHAGSKLMLNSSTEGDPPLVRRSGRPLTNRLCR